MSASTSNTSSPGGAQMDRRLLEAATSGDARSMMVMASQDPSVLLGTTPQGNTCLHLSSIYGDERLCHKEFRKEVLALEPSLLAAVNSDGETPLITAVTSGHASLASVLLGRCRALELTEEILQPDNNGCNALHHAIRSGHKVLALELIAAEPALSQGVNKFSESPMFIAVMIDSTEVFLKLLEVPNSSQSGSYGYNALHAAVRNENIRIVKLKITANPQDITKKIMETRPWLAREENKDGNTPMQLAVRWDKIDMLRVFLEHDCSLGYVVNKTNGYPLLVSAAHHGHVSVAQELLKHCPDSPYCKADGWTCLHAAVRSGHTEFVDFILGAPQLRKLVDMRTNNGKTALHYAVQKRNPKIVAALLDKGIDFTILCNDGNAAAWELRAATNHAKTLHWNEVSMLMRKADRRNASSVDNLHVQAKEKVTNESRKDIKSLTQTYTSNTSLVAILIATITFAAAFTLPGGYSTDSGSEGLPIMARKFAFQAFLISDTLAMCSSLVVAFICIIARWEDLEFLLYYRSFTKKLMWFAFIATTTAFATGLYTNEVSMLMLKADPRNATSVYNLLHVRAKEKVTNESRKDIKSLTQTYTSNTSLVAILIATITFAAAFALPGGYSTDSGSEGLPIMARKFAFQAFLISDTLAMCSSLAVAFICIIARWEDLEFLLYYRSFTKKLMWFAYMATTTAFATGLYTVLAPRILWLAIGICSLPLLLPIATKLLGEWPVLRLRVRLGQTFKSDFLDMV